MFSKIFIEKNVVGTPYTQNILNRVKKVSTHNIPVVEIENYQDIFEKVKRPYLSKRHSLQLFIAKKTGEKVKLAPHAYGNSTGIHYYFIHTYNCIYECQYCFLQASFHSPDIVLFANHDEILHEVEKTLNKHSHSDGPIWFHGGEYSDSLALTHITQELPLYHQFFQNNPRAIMELRTKSANINEVLKLEPIENFITTFSISPQNQIDAFDLKTPKLKARLAAMRKLQNAGHPVGLHLDPIISTPNFKEEFSDLAKTLTAYLDFTGVKYISLGVVRFTKKAYTQVQKNYPDSALMNLQFAKAHDQKLRYPTPLSHSLLKMVRSILIENQIPQDLIYYCMENESQEGEIH